MHRIVTSLILAAVTAAATTTVGAPAHATELHTDKSTYVRVIAAGDSITNGGGTTHPLRESWPAVMGIGHAGVGGACIVTEGCGSGTPPFVQTYNREVLAKEPDVVIIAFGMNDLILSTPKEITDGMKDLKRRNDARGIVTYVATLTPVGERMKGLDPARKQLNERIKKRFDAWRVIDFNAALRGPDGRLPVRYDSGDGLHPNVAAYRVMARFAAAAIAAR